MTSRHRHLIWDWNGTLLNDAWLCRHAANVLLERRRLPPMSEERYMEIFGFPLEEYYQKAGFRFDTESFEAVGLEFMAIYEHQLPSCHLRDGARDFLRAWRASGRSQAVLSAQQHDLLGRTLAHHRILAEFDLVLGVDSHYARGKIAQGAVLMERLRWKPAETVLVGDTLHDADVARAIGVDMILLDGGNQSVPRLAASGLPVARDIPHLAELLGL